MSNSYARGTACESVDRQFNRIIKDGEKHLILYESVHGKNSDYTKRAEALEAQRKFHRSLLHGESVQYYDIKPGAVRRG